MHAEEMENSKVSIFVAYSSIQRLNSLQIFIKLFIFVAISST